MSSLRNADITWLLRRMPRALREYVETEPPMKIFVAGGFVRSVIAGEVVNDVDVFTDSFASARALAERLGAETVETPNAITVRSTSLSRRSFTAGHSKAYRSALSRLTSQLRALDSRTLLEGVGSAFVMRTSTATSPQNDCATARRTAGKTRLARCSGC